MSCTHAVAGKFWLESEHRFGGGSWRLQLASPIALTLRENERYAASRARLQSCESLPRFLPARVQILACQAGREADGVRGCVGSAVLLLAQAGAQTSFSQPSSLCRIVAGSWLA